MTKPELAPADFYTGLSDEDRATAEKLACSVCGNQGWCGTHMDQNLDNQDDEP